MGSFIDSIDLHRVDHLFYAAVSAIVLYYVLDTARFSYLEWQKGCKPIYKGNPNWFLGFPFTFRMMKLKKEGRIIDFAHERFEDMGDTGTFRVAGVSVITTREPENIKAILGTQFNDFSLGVRHAHFDPLLGDGIFTLDGEGWKHSRAMLRPQFAREQVAHVQSLEPHIQLLAEHIRKHKGKSFDIQDLFFKLTVDSATEFLFGESVASLQDGTVGSAQEQRDVVDFDGRKGFADAFNESQKVLGLRSMIQDLYFLVDSKKFRKDCETVHVFSDYYVQKALNATQSELDEKSKNGYIFLYELVKETRNPKVLRDQLLNILLAGRDTTAGLLSFCIFELARNPKVWETLKQEIYENFGQGDDARIDEITFESLKKCQYLKAVLNEILRLYPSVPQNFRIATKDTTLPRGGGKDGQSPIFIRKGKNVIYSVSSMHRNSKHYGEDCNVFRPERWLTGETKKLGWAYLPFNGGPRICLGQQFALTEASYVIARLAQIFPNLQSFDDEYPPRKSSHLTMCHQEGVFVGFS